MEIESAPTAKFQITGEEQKYLKQLPKLFTENGILCRRYFAHGGKILYKQSCVPKITLKEVTYRIQNAPTAGHMGITRTIEDS